MDRRESEQAQKQAKAAHDRQHHTRLLAALSFYLQRGGHYTLRQQHPGDGSGVPHNHIRLMIEVEAPLFWRTFSELRERAGRRRDRTR